MFLLFFFQIFKVYSRQVSSSSVAFLCLFAKGEVKNLSKVELLFFSECFKVIQTLVFNQNAKSVHLSFSAFVIRRHTSRCLECKQPSRVGVSPLCDVVSSFLCHTHTDGKDKLLEWPDGSCLLLYVHAHIH